MVTNFGKFCRKMRIDRGEVLTDMSDKLDVSAAFLSKVENGRSKPPIEWEERIIKLYELGGDKEEEFRDCFYKALNFDKIDIKNFSEEDRDLMLSFARKFHSFDKEEMKRFIGK